MSNNNKLFRLYPLTPFYFGGDKTFGETGTEYFVKSNHLPQQTAILGLLRHQVLIHNGLIGKTKSSDDVRESIGPESFDIEGTNTNIQNFGYIQDISPVFLMYGNELLIPQSLNWSRTLIEKDELIAPIQFDLNPNEHWHHHNTVNNPPKCTILGQDYNPKFELQELWVSSDGKNQYLWDFDKEFKEQVNPIVKNGLFVKQEQVGIFRHFSRNKDRSIKSEDNSDNFHKQILFNFSQPSICFAFYSSILNDAIPDGEYRICFGGERSLFRLIVEKNTQQFKDIFNQPTFSCYNSYNSDVVVLTSDSYVPEDTKIFEIFDFAISDTLPFQNLKTTYSIGNNYAKIGAGITKSSKKYILLRKGSVFYLKQGIDRDSAEAIFTNKQCQNIGFNHFQFIKKHKI